MTKTSNIVPVSVCIPVYNGALHIRDAIRSLLNQTVTPQEIIVSDSGSSDESADIIREEAQRAQTEITILPTKTPGMVANWNSCIRAASAKYIKFLFQDDLLHEKCLEEMLKVAESDQRIGLVFSQRKLLIEPSAENDAFTKWLVRYPNLSAAFGKLGKSQPGALLLKSPKLLEEPLNKIGEPTAVLVRRALFDQVGLFNENMRQLVDMEMWVRVMAISDVGYISNELASVRVHPQRASSRHVSEEISRLEHDRLFDTLRSPTLYPLLHWRVQRVLRFAQRRHPLFVSHDGSMLRRLKDLVWAVLPSSFRHRLHYFRHYEDYMWMPRHAVRYADDAFFTFNTAPFLDDEKFLAAYHAGVQTNSWHGISMRWRAYIAYWAASYASQLDGDFVECGADRGGFARAIVDYIGFERSNKCFYLIGTFDGTVPAYGSNEETKKDGPSAHSYYEDNSAEIVEKTFGHFRNVKVVPGVVPDILSSLAVNRVAFLLLDMNCTTPEIQAAEHFWPRMCPGGVMVLDDYNNPQHRERQKSFDRFARDRGLEVMALPTGQGLIFKNVET